MGYKIFGEKIDEILRSKKLDLRFVYIERRAKERDLDQETLVAYNELRGYYIYSVLGDIGSKGPQRLYSPEINDYLESLMNTFEQTLGGKENGKSDRN